MTEQITLYYTRAVQETLTSPELLSDFERKRNKLASPFLTPSISSQWFPLDERRHTLAGRGPREKEVQPVRYKPGQERWVIPE